MLAEIIKYKHYLIVLAALLVANYVIVPLSELHDEQKLNLQLLSKQYEKTQSLMGNQDTLTEKLADSNKQIALLDKVLFIDSSEAQFKLAAQSLVEKTLLDGKCDIERIGFIGNTQVNKSIERWLMEVRLKGDINCLTYTTRTLESLSPHIEINEYNFNHRSLTENVSGKLNAQIQLNVWYKEVNE